MTRALKIHGHDGAEQRALDALVAENPIWSAQLHPDFTYTAAEVIRAVRDEMAQTLEDVLARRLRMLFLNARAAKEIAEKIVGIMAGELRKDQSWIDEQLKKFREVADGFLIH